MSAPDVEQVLAGDGGNAVTRRELVAQVELVSGFHWQEAAETREDPLGRHRDAEPQYYSRVEPEEVIGLDIRN
jgi:hypothetical protein